MTQAAPFDRWVTVRELAEAEGASRREVYAAIDRGMRHARVGRAIRVRRADWAAWWAAHAIGGAR